MRLYRVMERAGSALADVLLFGVAASAMLLSPFRLGRLLRTVSLPRLREHRLRTSVTIAGIALGVAVLVAVATVNRSIMLSVSSTIDDVAGKADLELGAGASGFDEALVDTVRSTPGVYKAAAVIEQTVTFADPAARGERLLVLGVDFLNADDDFFRTYGSAEVTSIERDSFTFLNSPYNVILASAVARKFGYRLHDHVALQTPEGKHDFEIWGFLGDEGVGRAFGGCVALMDYGAMQIAFDRGKHVDRVDIAVEKGIDPVVVARALKSSTGPGFTVDRPARRNERVSNMLATLRNGLTLASLVALVVGMFLIHNTISISVVQRRKEIGILRALGATRRDVLVLFTLEGFLFGVIGSALGVATGLGLSQLMLNGMVQTVSEMFLPVSTSRVQMGAGPLCGMAAMGVGASTLAASFPAFAAARASTVETLRGGAVLRRRLSPTRPVLTDWAAVALFAAAEALLRVSPIRGIPIPAGGACLLLTLAAALLCPRLVQASHAIGTRLTGETTRPEVRLATENLPRDVARTSATVSALMVGVAMATAFAVFVGSFESSTVDWVDQTLPADLWITSAARVAGGGAALPMTFELAAPLARIPGVQAVERVRMDDIEYRGFPVKLVASELAPAAPRIRLMMLEGSQPDAIRKMRTGALVVAENFSRRFGIHAGDRVALGVRNGTHWFDVAGVIVDYTSDSGMLMMDRDTYLEYWGDDRVDTYKLYLAKGADPEPVRRAINAELSSRYDLFVLTNREFRDEVIAMLDQAFQVMHLLEGVAIVISVLGVVNALLASVLDRVREIGVLRAVGMLRRQVIRMVVFEGLLVGIMGVVGGVALGLSIGHVLLGYINVVQTGWYLPYRPAWGGVVETALLVAIGSACAGFYPARYAAQLAVSEALSYE